VGIWSIEGFASDDALDWLQSLDASEGTEPVIRALRYVLDSSDPRLDARRAAVALTAAELVAALHGHAHPALPESGLRWVEALARVPRNSDDAEGPVLATRALDYVVTSSELSEIWSQRSDERQWRAALDDLRMRLAAAGGSPPANLPP
jgi:hypothetical protein